MKKFLFGFIILFFVASVSYSQTELPEPTGIPSLIYEAEISWGTLTTSSAWASIPITYSISNGIPITTHKYSALLGQQIFEAVVANNDTANPQKIVANFAISSLPSQRLWWFYRIHIRAKTTDVVGPWSDNSYWVLIYNLTKPGIPISK
jgi:hypothetical protein